jgi:hypothetical protein
MPIETFAYQADGLDMKGRLVLPDPGTGPRPAVLVFPHATEPASTRSARSSALPKRSAISRSSATYTEEVANWPG